jgi:hypothetical protein
MNKTSLSKAPRWLTFATLFVLAALVHSACGIIAIQGTGNLVNKSRDVGGFDRVSLKGMGEVILTQSEEESLSVETDDNMLKYVKTEVRDGTLYLDIDAQRAAFLYPSQLTFTLSVKDLAGLSILGSGDIKSGEINTERLELAIDGSGDMRIGSLETKVLELDISGSGNVVVDSLVAEQVKSSIKGSGEVDLAGQTSTQDVEISGSGEYRTGNLESETIWVSLSGSGNAVVWSTSSLKASTSGSGSVNFYGSPTIDFSGSGSGEIKNLGDK